MIFLSSQQAHRLRLNTLDHMKTWLKEQKKVDMEDARVEIMKVSMFSSVTADRYIKEIIELGVAHINDGHLVYNHLKEKET